MSDKFSLVNKTTHKLPVGFLKIAKRLLQITVSIVKQPYQEISIVFTGPVEIRQLNKVYRQHDKVTDVLSFILEPKPLVGEIVICLDQAAKQAKRHQHTLTKELVILIIHGLVHLFGFDHIKLKDRLVMRPLEKQILKKYEN